VQIAVTPERVAAEKVDQVLYHVSQDEKFNLLLGLLQREQPERVLIFVNMKVVGEKVADRLAAHGYQVRAITGDVEQRVRLKIMDAFKGGRLHILVATDVASRGLHIEAVSHVINYDLPQDAEDYVHRIGRTARAGATGKAISLCDEEGAFYLEAIEKFIGHKVPVDWADESLFLPMICELCPRFNALIFSHGTPGPKRQFTAWSLVVTVGTLGVKVNVGSGVLVGKAVALGGGVSVGNAGVSVKAGAVGVSVVVALNGRLHDDAISIINRLKIKNLYFINSPLIYPNLIMKMHNAQWDF